MKGRRGFTKSSLEYHLGYHKYKGFTGRSMKAYLADRAKTARVTNNLDRWKKNPRKYDYPGLDTPLDVFAYYKRSEKKPRRTAGKNKSYRRYWY